MSNPANHPNKQKAQTRAASTPRLNNIAVKQLYLSHGSNDDHKIIVISSLTNGSRTENKISLKLKHPGNFGLLELSYKGPNFHHHFPADATVEMTEMLLKESTTKKNKFSLEEIHNESWNIVHIDTKKESDCNYLFTQAIKNKYTVLLTILFEIIDGNNLSRQFTLYLDGVDGLILHRAVTEKNTKIIAALLKCELNANTRNNDNWTPLHVAIDLEMPQVVDLLINNGADINAQNNEHQVPLHQATKINTNLKILNSLLKSQAELDIKDKFGKTPLHYAVEAKNYHAVELILKNNPNINIGDDFGNTALHLALEAECFPIIELLLENKADVNLENKSEKTPLDSVMMNPNISFKIIKSVLNSVVDIHAKFESGVTLVHLAAYYQNVKVIKYLINQNADVNAKDLEGRTPLHASLNMKLLYTGPLPDNGLYNSCFKCIKTLIDCAADVNAVDNELITPLHQACFFKNAKVVKYLIKNGADPFMRDIDGKTVFHYVCTLEVGEEELPETCYIEQPIKDILNVLIEENISINWIDKNGETPLHYVTDECFDLFMHKELLNLGADINIKDKYYNSPFDYLIEFLEDCDMCEDIFELHYKHIIKLKVMKWSFPINYIDRIYDIYSGESLEWMKHYEQDCNKEINLMKSTYFDQSHITYYEYLNKSPHYLMNFTRNANVINAIQSDMLTKIFPNYGHFLKCHFRKVTQRNYLCEKIFQFFKLFVFKELPILCMYEILKYLENSELILFYEAVKTIIPEK